MRDAVEVSEGKEAVGASHARLLAIGGLAVVACLIAVAAVYLLGRSAKGPYDDERARWGLMCSAVAGPPNLTLDEEFSGQGSVQSRMLFDDYLLKEPVEEFPSPVRADLLALRQADIDYRAGKLTAPQARSAGESGERALTDQHFNGACSWFRRQGS